MLIDCCTCLTKPKDTIAQSQYREALEPIDKAILLAPLTNDNQVSNKLIIDFSKGNSKILPYASINPVTDKIGHGSLNSLKETGFMGFVLRCSEAGFHPGHSRAMRFYEQAQSLSMPIFFENCSTNPSAMMEFSKPFLLDQVAREFSELKIIVGSMGMPFLEQTIALLAKHPHVYGCLTIRPEKLFRTYTMLRASYEADVANKLVFGSNYPQTNISEAMEVLLGFNRFIQDTNLPVVPLDVLRKIIHKNSHELLGVND